MVLLGLKEIPLFSAEQMVRHIPNKRDATPLFISFIVLDAIF
jgi:hypothetical protein